MAYVEWHQTVLHHLKTTALMRALGIPRREAVGIIGSISAWCIGHRPGGVFEQRKLANILEWEGDEARLIEAIVGEDRWLDRVDEALVAVHDWKEITRGFRKARRDAARKKRERRDAVRGASVDGRGITRVRRPERSGTERSGAERSGAESKKTAAPPRETSAPPVPDPLRGLPLYERDLRLRRKFAELWPSWRQAFPDIDITGEIRKAHAWELANTIKVNRPAFFNRWFGKAQDDYRKTPPGLRGNLKIGREASCPTCLGVVKRDGVSMMRLMDPAAAGGYRYEPCPACNRKPQTA